jgi:hypothetical protein
MANIVEIPEEDLREFQFNHKSVRAYISGARPIVRADPSKPDLGKTDIVVDFIIREHQPEHPDIAEAKTGERLTMWLRPYGNGVKNYKEFCRALSLDPRKPDLELLENAPVIIAVKTNNDYVNVNKVTAEVL